MNLIMIKILRSACRSNVSKNVTRSLLSSSVIHRDNLNDTSQLKPAYQSVTDFYAGKSVLLTGATGFIGRILIERLLYTCKDIENIYVLIREKKEATAQQRLQELLHSPVFTKLKRTRPQDFNKIVPISGDVGEVGLGMKLDDEQTLIEKVSVIFHSAADVRYRSHLSDLMRVNYEGTKQILELGKKTKNLDMFVYVSTAFHNSTYTIDEFPHTPPKDIDDVYRVLNNNDPDEIRKLLDPWGNSYIFSKNMTDAYVANNYGTMPTIIVRPTMVTSVYKDPVVGYTDSWMIGTVLLSDIASGFTRVVYGDKYVKVVFQLTTNTKCNVYNFGTGHYNPVNWDKLTDLYIREGKKHDYAVMPFPMVYFTRARWAMPVLTFLTQIVPAFIGDVWLRLTGRKPRYIQLQKSVISRTKLSIPMTVSSWDIRTSRAKKLLSTLNDEDRRTFPCDPVTIDWNKYVPIYCKGVKDYMLNGINKKK